MRLPVIAAAPIRSRPLWWLLLALLPFAAVAVVRWHHAPPADAGDYAHYLLHAKSLVEGRPYSDIGYIYTDLNLVGPRNQPPGWPLVLVPFVAVFGVHSAVFKLLVTLLVAAFGVTAATYFARRGETAVAIAVAAATPIALESQYATASALSDPLFCVLVWSVLLLVDVKGGIRPWRGIAIAVMVIALVSVRVAGFAMVPALLLHAILRPRPGRMWVAGPMVVLLIGGGLAAAFAVADVPFLARGLAGLSDFRINPLGLMRTYRQALSAGALFPFGSEVANDVYHAAMAVPLVVGGVRFIRNQAGTALWCFVLTYATVLAVAPVRESRYAWPLTPLVMMCIVTGLAWLGERFMRRDRRAAAFVPALVIAVAIGAAVQLARLPARPSLEGHPETQEVFAWARMAGAAAPASVRVVFPNPRVLTLETGVSAMGIPGGSESEVLAELESKLISHVIVPLVPTTESERRLAQFVSHQPNRFPPVFRNTSYDVRRFVTPAVGAPDSARTSGPQLPSP